jgi:hypothetical protein
MEQQQRGVRRRAHWFNKKNKSVKYDFNPGVLLAQQIQWQYNNTGFTEHNGLDPDVVNFGVLAHKPLNLPLPQLYHVKPELDRNLWITFGRYDNPRKFLLDIWDWDFLAYWIGKTTKQPRIFREETMPNWIFAKDLTQEQRQELIEKLSMI